ncbi:MAG TPA: DUF542 domain-containing protein [Elusimicrobiota bacterium]|nr:DUF542 domain-containing protein [Elusimicrobiota bacterium]
MKPEAAVNLSWTVNEVAERYPKTREVLARYGLDLCCGGAHPLEFAAQAHGIDARELSRELNACVRP